MKYWMIAILAGAFAPAHATPQMFPELVRTEAGETIAYEQGAIVVPAHHGGSPEQFISIPFIRLRSTAAKPAEPIFVLAGGPGSSGINDFLHDKTNQREALFFRTIADVILFDQRGSAGRALPRLDCPEPLNMPLDKPFTYSAYREAVRGIATRCKAAWQATGVDLQAYNTVENVGDLQALRKELGYGRITIAAGSYGSHFAIATMRYAPQIVARAMLRGIEGPDHTYDVPSETLGDLERIAAAAEAAPGLREMIPPGGLLAALKIIEGRLAKDPVTIQVSYGGRTLPLLIGKEDIQMLALSGAHDRTDMRWAADVIDMYRGDFSGMADRIVANRKAVLDGAMFYMFDCASGISPARKARILADPATALLGDINADYFAVCGIWNPHDLGPIFRSPLHTAVPILIFTGSWDVSTPMPNAYDVARGLSNVRLVRVEGGTHNTFGDLLREWPGMTDFAGAFLRGRSLPPLDRVDLPPVRFAHPKPR
jgi:pimeloyl-ACP methyl ester carboxylesterase